MYNIDSREFGTILAAKDHTELHTAGWNKDWGDFVKGHQARGTKPTLKEVQEHLKGLASSKKYCGIFSRGVCAPVSHGVWRDWYRKALVDKIRARLVAKALQRARRRAAKGIPLLGSLVGLWFYAEDVSENGFLSASAGLLPIVGTVQAAGAAYDAVVGPSEEEINEGIWREVRGF